MYKVDILLTISTTLLLKKKKIYITKYRRNSEPSQINPVFLQWIHNYNVDLLEWAYAELFLACTLSDKNFGPVAHALKYNKWYNGVNQQK